MAKRETWEKVKAHFRPDSPVDQWGNPDAISDELVLILFDFRRFVRVPIYVICGTQGAHSSKSYHYIDNGACAVDVAIPEWKGTPLDLYLAAERFNFTGLGFYPDWTWKGVKANGLHLDTRPLKWDDDLTLNYTQNRWLAYNDENGKQQYTTLSEHSLRKYGGLK